MVLTVAEIDALKRGTAVPCTLEEAGTPCVLVRADVFETLKQQAEGFADLRPRETYAAVLRALDAVDEHPDQYLEYLND